MLGKPFIPGFTFVGVFKSDENGIIKVFGPTIEKAAKKSRAIFNGLAISSP